MNQGYGNNGFNGRGLDDEDNKKTKNKKKTTTTTGSNKGPIISGQGLGNSKDTEMIRNQFKVKGVGKSSGG